MKSINLTLRVYGNTDCAVNSASFLLENELKDLDAKADISMDKTGWICADITGEDEDFAANFLKKKYGMPIKEVRDKEIYRGFIASLEDDGIIVDIGVPLKIPDTQLKGLGVGTPTQIYTRFGFVPYLPVAIKVIKDNNETFAAFTKKQVDIFWGWKKSTTDRLIVNSVTRSNLKKAIRKTGHLRDIYGIERIGLLENMIICREKTDGPGIVAQIGPLLNADIGVIIANK